MSPIIEVLIGMVFLYSLLSILVTQVNAFIANILKLRAKHLRGAIDELVEDPILRARIITHPLIRLSKEKMLLPEQKLTDSEAEAIINGALNNLTWIAPKTFVNVLTNIISVSSHKELFGALLTTIDSMPDGEDRRRLRLLVTEVTRTGEGVPELRSAIENLADPTCLSALNKVMADIDKKIADIGLEPDNNIAMTAGLRNIKNPYFRTAMETMLATSKTLEEAEQKIAEWFNEGMDRASESFKQTMQVWSLLIGFVLAFLLNIDSLYIAQTLWNDPALRETLAATASSANIAALENTVEQAQTDIETPATDDPAANPLRNAEQSLTSAGSILDDILELRLPLGWSFDNLSELSGNNLRIGDSRYVWNYMPANNPNWLVLWIAKLLGLFATMIAIAQGAPFWFGMLRKLSGGSS